MTTGPAHPALLAEILQQIRWTFEERFSPEDIPGPRPGRDSFLVDAEWRAWAKAQAAALEAIFDFLPHAPRFPEEGLRVKADGVIEAIEIQSSALAKTLIEFRNRQDPPSTLGPNPAV
jgi:hypothetical protein